jgi:hypothetical protein
MLSDLGTLSREKETERICGFRFQRDRWIYDRLWNTFRTSKKTISVVNEQVSSTFMFAIQKFGDAK